MTKDILRENHSSVHLSRRLMVINSLGLFGTVLAGCGYRAAPPAFSEIASTPSNSPKPSPTPDVAAATLRRDLLESPLMKTTELTIRVDALDDPVVAYLNNLGREKTMGIRWLPVTKPETLIKFTGDLPEEGIRFRHLVTTTSAKVGFQWLTKDTDRLRQWEFICIREADYVVAKIWKYFDLSVPWESLPTTI